ncbi:hypothetical protein QZH41_007714 [Actinostola sp. cb2023]|nr:hypothetical protein QZH41_007714 [Actinostola sp. cb2023]
MLSDSLCHSQCETCHAESDADLLIVKTAVEFAQTRTTILVGDDTDLLILLLFYVDPDGYNLFFIPEPKTNSLRYRVWNIKSIQAQLGKEVCRNILFIHAVLGCDTTSRAHEIGKGSALKKFITSAHFREQAEVFNGIATKEAIETAGHNALVIFYNEKPRSQLDDIRYQCYKEKLATRPTHIQHNNLAPTSAAAKYHSYRVYAQILQWKGNDEDVEEWSWKVRDGQVILVMTYGYATSAREPTTNSEVKLCSRM